MPEKVDFPQVMMKAAGFGKQFKEAKKSGARYALILGEEEELKNEVKIKDLKSSAEISTSQNDFLRKLDDLDAEGGINTEV